MPKSSKIRVLIADDHAILRSGLKMLIDSQADMTVVGEAQNGNEAILMAREISPDIVLLDVTMPQKGGLHAIHDILANNSSVGILLLTMHEEPAFLRTALAAGASGYVLKKSVDAELATGLLEHAVPERIRSGNKPSEVLSERELQVLKLVAEGFSSREISEQIFIGTKTVETYRGRFAEKLGLKSRADIVRYALEIGLLTPEKFSLPKRS